jgi:CRISPR-associated protein Cas2
MEGRKMFTACSLLHGEHCFDDTLFCLFVISSFYHFFFLSFFMLLVVSYDIVDTKKRTKLAKKLLNFGARVQYSVFECDLDKKQLQEMKKQLLPYVDPEKDSLRIYKLCEACAPLIESFGVKKGWEEQDVIVS